ncbi:peptidyl-prolyl cis-trans isomerase [Kordia sp. YSTF-M3]|uniref:Peptidyl-prolyl cis-trans isomerase n=1 Tax=Kordia aestuariivivens TaxID=2759037 RepID=A0ABR7QFS8_9FLAO|nr:peptidyl-prolyl cis-trans isomerase [Kordia aestuariivivens]MBC8757353.1 peptidyl-prolyl cis-trans isomerase [Kordia aestuariivivens]
MKKLSLIVSIFLCISCEYFQSSNDGEPVARVGESYLYKSDLEPLLSETVSSEDSTIIVNNYINRWATQELFIQRAKINLTQEKQDAFEELVAEYRQDLYIEAYKEAIVKKTIDTTVTAFDEAAYYNVNKENFKLNEELLKLRYINIGKDNSNIEEITERFKRFNVEDKEILDSLAIQFNNYSLNDSIWVKETQVFNKIPVITNENKDKYLKKSQFSQIEDSLEVYLVRIEDKIGRNDIAPLAYVRPTVRQIILNKRKLEFIRKLEKDITKDAVKQKQFETYN